MPIKSFRGKLADEATETIVLHTNNGSIGYRIKKFELMLNTPGASTQESIVKIFSIPQYGSPDGVIDFSDNTLLAAGYYEYNSGSSVITTPYQIVFDSEIFNQDIYITHKDLEAGESINYYIELEQIKLDLNENTVATLKDIKNVASQTL
tara:strand:- start:53 stop:502 length:450 start_codon:yes stop_codon:yes gene_type:complete